MSKVTIVSEGLKDLNSIKRKLEDRDSQVTIMQSIGDIENVVTDILICSNATGKTLGNENQLLSVARKLKISKVILIESYASDFKITKELGGSLIKINMIKDDVYSEEVLIAFCSESHNFITGGSESLKLKNLAKKVASTDVTLNWRIQIV